MMTIAVVSFQVCSSVHNTSDSNINYTPIILQWFLWGFSLTFSDSAGLFIGDLSTFFFPGLSHTS